MSSYLGQGGHHEVENGHASGALSEQGDVVRVSVEELDVLFDPLQCKNLITKAQISGCLRSKHTRSEYRIFEYLII